VHQRYHTSRRRILAALVDAADLDPDPPPLDDPHPARRLANKLTACCRGAVATQDTATGQISLEAARCNSRICPRCAAIRARELRECVESAVALIDAPAMITLTLASSDDPLAEQIDRIKHHARQMRRRKAWKLHVAGGIEVLEITYNARRNQWHPHLHILADMRYWKQASLSREWHAVTGDSRICDVRRLSSKKQIAAYVTKYVSKGTDADSLPGRAIAEWALAIHGVRVAQTFGSLHGHPTRRKREKREGEYAVVAYVGEIADAADRGDASAALLLARLEALPRISSTDPASSGYLPTHRKLGEDLRAWIRLQRDGPPPPPPKKPTPNPQRPLFEPSYEEKKNIGLIDTNQGGPQ